MALIEWRKEFETGIAEIDHEHRQLISLINQLDEELGREASQERIEMFLGEVLAKISAHFALEEANMRRFGYERYAEHKAEHERLLDELRDIMDDCEHGRYGDSRKRLSAAVQTWFVDHFKTHDALLHRSLGI
ncbi:MAG: bacteriohemerythrin [Rhodovibrionaceae bacterium]|nr:bacteriohemerythrin [Rhodovibrionaceae bacterium]